MHSHSHIPTNAQGHRVHRGPTFCLKLLFNLIGSRYLPSVMVIPKSMRQAAGFPFAVSQPALGIC